MMVRVKLFRVSKTIVHMIHDMNVQRILNVRKRQDNERQCGSLQSLRGMRSLIKSADTMRNLSLSLVYQRKLVQRKLVLYANICKKLFRAPGY